MANLEANQALQIVKGKLNYNHSKLEAAALQDERMQLHTYSANDSKELPYYEKYIKKVSMIISPEKLNVFKNLQSIPFETSEILEENYRQIEKIFETEDRNITHSFKTPKNKEDFEKYLKEINDFNFWKTEGMSMLKSNINGYIVVDYPSIESYQKQGLPRPDKTEPYYYSVYAKNVKAVEYSKKDPSKVEFIVFTDPKDPSLINVFDDSFIRIYKQEGSDFQLAFEPVEHGFSRCPVTPFYHNNFSKDNNIQKKGLATNLISKLEWVSIKITMSKHAELYSGFPITASYEEECDYTDPQGNSCENGAIHSTIKVGVGGHETQDIVTDCPKCNNNSNLGAGTHKVAPAMADKDDPDLLEAMKFIQIPVDQLDRLEKSIGHEIDFVNKHMIGSSKSNNKEAINEMQVMSDFYEERKSVLDQVKRNFEKTHKFVIERMAEIRYGEDYEGTYLSYGNKYFLYNHEELTERYIEYKKNGVPEYMLSDLSDQINETKFRTDKQGKTRNKILSDLMPYTHYSINDIKEISAISPELVDMDLMLLRVNFFKFISKFEAEYLPVESVLPMMPIERKIEFINSKLMEYVNEQRERAPRETREALQD